MSLGISSNQLPVDCRDLDQLPAATAEDDEVDSVISNDSLDKYEQRMNAECDLNSKEDRRRSSNHFFFLNHSLSSTNKNSIPLPITCTNHHNNGGTTESRNGYGNGIRYRSGNQVKSISWMK